MITFPQTPTRPTHKAGKGISRRIESVASQKEVPGRKLKKAGNDIPTTSGTKSQIMMRLEKMVEESDIMHSAIRSVDFDEGVFGFAHSEIIAKEDMQQLFEHEELGIAIIHTYIWYMYVTLMRGTELCNRFNFIAASRINTTFITKNPTSVKNELVDRFMVADDNTTPSLYFLPFNSGNGGHWVLVAMDLSRLMVYYLDSLSGDWSKYPSMKKTVDAISFLSLVTPFAFSGPLIIVFSAPALSFHGGSFFFLPRNIDEAKYANEKNKLFVKQYGSLATLVSHITGLQKLFKEKDWVAREKELESKCGILGIGNYSCILKPCLPNDGSGDGGCHSLFFQKAYKTSGSSSDQLPLASSNLRFKSMTIT
ncbi:hypothetical protein KIW84_074529 [Lathyrus oleraceus]|uniref:Ubiquitin-like protease family profile domain-containing protein n=1 Tax=Pisum sativum TaxID=3888 RepID=A0A9D4VRI0_PEA|nr:hypothetical protein KIW84_074529 [Pisum sativum]